MTFKVGDLIRSHYRPGNFSYYDIARIVLILPASRLRSHNHLIEFISCSNPSEEYWGHNGITDYQRTTFKEGYCWWTKPAELDLHLPKRLSGPKCLKISKKLSL